MNRSDSAASKAAGELEQAKGKYARATLWLGKMQEQLGDSTKAKELYERAAESAGQLEMSAIATLYEQQPTPQPS